MGLRLVESASKRALDLIAATCLLAVALPLLAASAIAIRLDSNGPVIFRPKRVGCGGRVFTMYKLRTMFADAEARLPQLSDRNQGGRRLIRIPDDPRITRVGKFLRSTSIDELPQLLNVIRGEMSLVGPRPQAPEEVALYSETERGRLSVRPGITGLWQVRARQSNDFADWVRFDLEYIESWSLCLDLGILLRTPVTILTAIAGCRSKDSSEAVAESASVQKGGF
jgi:lipopolysaccharide/colanic/teichoic acid biosynthesis glycosyltransferase